MHENVTAVLARDRRDFWYEFRARSASEGLLNRQKSRRLTCYTRQFRNMCIRLCEPDLRLRVVVLRRAIPVGVSRRNVVRTGNDAGIGRVSAQRKWSVIRIRSRSRKPEPPAVELRSTRDAEANSAPPWATEGSLAGFGPEGT